MIHAPFIINIIESCANNKKEWRKDFSENEVGETIFTGKI